MLNYIKLLGQSALSIMPLRHGVLGDTGHKVFAQYNCMHTLYSEARWQYYGSARL